MQVKRENHDKKKNKFMIKRKKILLRFWEDDIYNNKEFIINKLNKLII